MPPVTPSPHSQHVSDTRYQPKRCPDCHSELIVWLVQMRQHDDSRDYYRCKECGNEFTLARPA
jgi:DNA-directed RNA polymerase subunit M/transcription elongation factor TFIIS